MKLNERVSVSKSGYCKSSLICHRECLDMSTRAFRVGETGFYVVVSN